MTTDEKKQLFKTIKEDVKWVLLFALLSTYVLRDYFKEDAAAHISKDSYITNIYDSSKHTTVVNNKAITAKGDTIYERIPFQVDSSKIVQLFFSRHAEQSYSEDSNLSLTIHDTIGENRILYRSYDYKIKRPTSIIQPIAKRRVISVGTFLTASPVSIGFGPLAQYKAKSDKIFQAGYDVVHPGVYVGFMSAVKLKKH